MRRRFIDLISVEEIAVKDALACDVVFYNAAENRLIIRREQKYWRNNESPVGIVIIPTSHGILKDGTGTVNQCGVISLVNMSYVTPEEGTEKNEYMYFGNFNSDINNESDNLGRYDSITDAFLFHTGVVITKNIESNDDLDTVTYSNNVFLPSTDEKHQAPHYPTSGNFIPSPYLGSDFCSGDHNPAYDTKQFGRENNYLCDYDGLQNTKIVTDKTEEWKEGEIKNVYNEWWYYPTVFSCARYKTEGTKAFKDCTTEELFEGSGFWYMPSAAEFGYVCPHIYKINQTINALKTNYGIGKTISTEHWVFRKISKNGAIMLFPDSGRFSALGVTNGKLVRAIMRLSS